MTYERAVDLMRLRVECDARFAPAVNDLFDTLEQRHRAGPPLHAGSRIRFGWSVLTLEPDPDGALRVREPDFDGDPLHATHPTLDVTLSVLVGQLAVAHRLGISPTDVWFEQSLVVQVGALEGTRLGLIRSASADSGDSGWFVADPERVDDEVDEAELAAAPVYCLLAGWRAALSASILPVGFTAEVDRQRILHVWDADGVDRWNAR